MTRVTDMLAILQTLDPADSDVDPHNPRARAELERIITTDPARPLKDTPVKARRRRGIRLAAAAATVVTAAAAFLILPSLVNGDRAFASWTATPNGLPAQPAADAGTDCRDAQLDGPGTGHGDDLRRADIAIAERRGEWTLVILAGAKGFSALCITDESTPLFRDWFGSMGTPTNYAPPGPRDVVATDLGTGGIDAGELSVAAGYAGSDVTGVTYHSATHGHIAATVSGGRFALWLPGDELDGASVVGVNVQVTHRDGSTATLRLGLR
ncbi:hypothetical protein [Kibdelosporangium phytohabitans]|uniref:Uncharacterized protein n=1 Tax=Kibdelosporangium phytohabitans TaxID=860235 RepID=A0A0N9I1A0_9PSEU|nr:hypothetical protein [Kibdelosporangium phytohabitans]ALG08226.1 hypothetical protein AOZ06_16080 [Kibdelosporangium phytohabitans]MBE1470768.1 hypothetical protein [Kibdelosporangium phytohabitans]